jgi:hypothetical protein
VNATPPRPYSDDDPLTDLAAARLRAGEPGALPSRAFADDEPVLQTHPLIDGVPVPVFGETTAWAMHATRRPANKAPSNWVVKFGALDPVWNLRARELVMAMLNPEHPAVLGAGVHLGARPSEISTVKTIAQQLGRLASWAADRGMPPDLGDWHDDDCRTFIAYRRTGLSAQSMVHVITVIKLLHRVGPVLTGGGLPADPWPGLTSRQAADIKASTREVKPPISRRKCGFRWCGPPGATCTCSAPTFWPRTAATRTFSKKPPVFPWTWWNGVWTPTSQTRTIGSRCTPNGPPAMVEPRPVRSTGAC